MDVNNTLASAGITAGGYILYKIAQRYYFTSGCHNRTLEITIVDRESEKKEEPPEIVVEPPEPPEPHH
jgi:hypothetical protein